MDDRDKELEEIMAEFRTRLKALALKRAESSSLTALVMRPENSQPLPWELPEGASGKKH